MLFLLAPAFVFDPLMERESAPTAEADAKLANELPWPVAISSCLVVVPG